jgi:hypothetical protein
MISATINLEIPHTVGASECRMLLHDGFSPYISPWFSPSFLSLLLKIQNYNTVAWERIVIWYNGEMRE